MGAAQSPSLSLRGEDEMTGRSAEYAAVIQELRPHGDYAETRTARIWQLRTSEVGTWPVLSGRCHIRIGAGFHEPRLGALVAYQLRAPHLLVMTRSNDRITVCEVEVDGVEIRDRPDRADVFLGWQGTLHKAIMAALDGELLEAKGRDLKMR